MRHRYVTTPCPWGGFSILSRNTHSELIEGVLKTIGTILQLATMIFADAY